MRKLQNLTRPLLFVVALLFLAHAHPASAVCSSNTYGNITCVKFTDVLQAKSCGISNTGVFTASTIGDVVLAWMTVTGGTLTSLAGNHSEVFTVVPNQGNQAWNTGGANTDSMWTFPVVSTAAMNITPTCSGGNAEGMEMWFVELHSSVGTVGISCSSNWTTVLAATTISSNCSSLTAAGLAISICDFNNTQPAAAGGATLMNDGAPSEPLGELKSVSATGTLTMNWTNSSDNMASQTIVFNDGGSTSSGGGGFGGKAGIGGKAGFGG